MLVTIEQYKALAQRVKYLLGKNAEEGEQITEEEMEMLINKQGFKIAPNLGGVMSKYGLELKSQFGSYVEIGGDWTIEFSVRLNKAMTVRPETAVMHFGIIDSNNIGLILGLSKEAKVNGRPSESFFLGDIRISDKVVYFDDLECTIADGATHHVYIEHQSVANQTTANIIVYIDGKLVVANNFKWQISDFRELIIGGESFVDKPSVENLVIFDRLRVIGENEILTSKSVPENIVVTNDDYDISDSTLLIYQNGMLNVYVEEATES